MAPAAASAAAGASWPTRPLHIIVPYAPGGTSDAVVRLLGERLQKSLAQPVVVENRPGAAGTTGMDFVAKSAPDGHTLAFAAISPLTLTPHLQRVPYEPLKDVVPVAQVMYSPVYVVATQAFAARTFAEAIAQAKARLGQVSIGTSGAGSLGHLMVELISLKAGVRFNHIPYKGNGQVLNDAIGGQFDLFTTNPSPALRGFIEQGKLRVLAVTAPQRLRDLPGVPTLAELGYRDASLGSVFGFFAPGGTPREVVARVNAEINQLLGDKVLQERLHQLDNVVSPSTPEGFMALVRHEHETNARVIREAGIKLE